MPSPPAPHVSQSWANSSSSLRHLEPISSRDNEDANRLLIQNIVRPNHNYDPPKNAKKSREVDALETFKSLISDEINGLTQEEKSLTLTKFRDAILRAELAYVDVANQEDGFTIFETLNDRGVGLAPSDLIKNVLFPCCR